MPIIRFLGKLNCLNQACQTHLPLRTTLRIIYKFTGHNTQKKNLHIYIITIAWNEIYSYKIQPCSTNFKIKF